MRRGRIVAMGGGGFSMEPDNPLLDDFVLRLAGAQRPRVCFVPTASGDAEGYVARFHDAFPPHRARASHLPLFQRDERDLRAHLLAQDVVYVGGGNTVNMLAVWRCHGVDAILREAWAAGVVLAGLSAGAMCWFTGGITDSFGGLAPLRDGLGLLAGTLCPHDEPARRLAYERAIEAGLPGGLALGDGAAAHFAGTDLVEVVTSRAEARAYRLTAGPGGVDTTLLPSRFLGGAGGPDAPTDA